MIPNAAMLHPTGEYLGIKYTSCCHLVQRCTNMGRDVFAIHRCGLPQLRQGWRIRLLPGSIGAVQFNHHQREWLRFPLFDFFYFQSIHFSNAFPKWLRRENSTLRENKNEIGDLNKNESNILTSSNSKSIALGSTEILFAKSNTHCSVDTDDEKSKIQNIETRPSKVSF